MPRFLLVCACLIFASPAQAAGVTYDAQPQLKQYAALVYWTYRDTYDKAKRLQDRIKLLLDNPTEKNLQKAREAWTAARIPYSQTEAFRFYEGPIDFVDQPTGAKGPESWLNAWPINEAYIDYVRGNPQAGIINDPAVPITTESLRAQNQAHDEADVATGYHAIEFLLWGQDFNPNGPGNRSFEDFKPGSPANDRRRQYLQVVTDMLLADLLNMVQSWEPGKNNYAKRFLTDDPQASLKKLMTGMATLSGFELAAERIGTGLDSGEQEDEQNCFSDTTLNDFINNAKGIQNIYLGRYGNHSGPSLSDLVKSLDPKLDAKMLDQFARTERDLAAIPAPYDQVLASPKDSEGRKKAEAAIVSLQQEAQLLKDIGKKLSVDVEIMSQ